MPIAKARLDRMISMIDSAWAKKRADEDRDTDPKQFLETASKVPIAAPPTMPQEDSAAQHIHGVGKRDLFK
jgi:hypothetical protein